MKLEIYLGMNQNSFIQKYNNCIIQEHEALHDKRVTFQKENSYDKVKLSGNKTKNNQTEGTPLHILAYNGKVE